MLNSVIFTVKKPDNLGSSSKIISSIFLPETAGLVNVLDNGSILLQKIGNLQPTDIALFKPDFLCSELKLICWTIILSPFNVFRQNGKWTLVGLYEDGRLRFWDLAHQKCYLISKHNDFKTPKNVTAIGPLLVSHKRFIYVLG